MYELWFKKKQKIQEFFIRRFPKRGEIWICDFGENIGSEQNFKRPCIILSSADKKENTCVVVPCSNTLREFSVTINQYHFLIHQIRTVDTKRLTRCVMRFSKEDTSLVLMKVFEYLE